MFIERQMFNSHVEAAYRKITSLWCVAMPWFARQMNFFFSLSSNQMHKTAQNPTKNFVCGFCSYFSFFQNLNSICVVEWCVFWVVVRMSWTQCFVSRDLTKNVIKCTFSHWTFLITHFAFNIIEQKSILTNQPKKKSKLNEKWEQNCTMHTIIRVVDECFSIKSPWCAHIHW